MRDNLVCKFLNSNPVSGGLMMLLLRGPASEGRAASWLHFDYTE